MTYLLCKFIKNNWQRRCRAAKLYSAKVFVANLPVTASSGSSFVGSVPKLLYLCGLIWCLFASCVYLCGLDILNHGGCGFWVYLLRTSYSESIYINIYILVSFLVLCLAERWLLPQVPYQYIHTGNADSTSGQSSY